MGVLTVFAPDGQQTLQVSAQIVSINEDRVTGSAHCYPTPFWVKWLGKDEMTVYQASGNGRVVRAKLAGERVLLLVRAVAVMKKWVRICLRHGQKHHIQ
ncbi:MAG: hypothetical protein IMZ73_12610 [Chloroflexi bacterium]|nr:hypothetical protein [Chloroflexota bacterium]